MGFWIMLASLIMGICLIIIGIYSKNETNTFGRYFKKISMVIGIIAVLFAIYLGWPK